MLSSDCESSKRTWISPSSLSSCPKDLFMYRVRTRRGGVVLGVLAALCPLGVAVRVGDGTRQHLDQPVEPRRLAMSKFLETSSAVTSILS